MSENRRLQRFEAHLRVHLDGLYRTALRMSRDPQMAEDLVQEASLRAYKSFAGGVEPENFRAWMFRILINLSVDWARRTGSGRTPVIAAQDVEVIAAAEPGPAESYANARLGRDLVAAVESLPDDLCLLVQLVLVEGLSYREAAESLDCPEGTVRSRLSRARVLLRRSLADHAPENASDRVVQFPQSKESRQ